MTHLHFLIMIDECLRLVKPYFRCAYLRIPKSTKELSLVISKFFFRFFKLNALSSFFMIPLYHGLKLRT